MKINKGFTLVELMVVVAVVVVLAGIGAASLNKFNNNQKLDAAKEELVTDLKLARNMATTSQLPSGVSGLLKYVEVVISNKTVTARGWVSDSSGQYFSKSNEVFNSISSSFGFSVENGRLTNGSGVLSADSLCLTLYFETDSTNRKFVNIETSGLIYEKGSCP